MPIDGMKVAVQGFGNVGSYLSKFLAQQGATVIAVSDSTSGIYNPKGIDVETAIAHKQETGSLAGLKDAEQVTNEELLLLECDVLAPCALEQVITSENADKIKAKIVCEGANGPTTPTADEILEDRGVLVLPDVLANAGGVVVSYFEWVQGLQEYFWKEDEVNARLNDISTRAFNETWAMRESRGTSMRMAAYGLAVNRVAEATTTRGLYPVAPPRLTLCTGGGLPPLRTRPGDASVEAQRGARLRARRGRDRRRRGARGALPRADSRPRDRREAGVRLLRRPGGAPSQARTNSRLGERLCDGPTHHPCGSCKNPCVVLQAPTQAPPDRLTVGVAARLSRYLQVLTQARKMGKSRISSQEISDYTNINATQIRRDLSAFGKFGKRGVGYNIDSLLGEIRKILRTQGQHNILLVGAGRLGEAIVSSPIFAEHGIHIAAIVDTDPEKVGRTVGDVDVSAYGEVSDLIREKNIIVGVLAVPATSAQQAAEDLVGGGVKIIFNYSEALLDVPSDVAVHTSNPAVDLLYALYFHLT